MGTIQERTDLALGESNDLELRFWSESGFVSNVERLWDSQEFHYG